MVELPDSKNRVVKNLTESITKMHTKVTTNLESTNAIYKVVLDQHHHHKVFEVGDLFMVHLQKPRFLVDTYHKLQLKQIDPYKFLDHFHIHIIDLTPYFPLD